MASFVIKEEPIDQDDVSLFYNSSAVNHLQTNSFIDSQLESEEFYLNKVNENVFNNEGDINDLIDFMSSDVLESNLLSLANSQLKHDDVLETMRAKASNSNTDQTKSKIFNSRLSKQSVIKARPKINNRQEQFIQEKKRILAVFNEQAKQEKNFLAKINNFESLSVSDETRLLDKLNTVLDKLEDGVDEEMSTQNQISDLRRFRAKLELRKLKRKNFVKLFNLDSFTNELIDQEKFSLMQRVAKKEGVRQAFNETEFPHGEESSDDIIFEGVVTLKASDSGCEIIELVRVLDRFNGRKFKLTSNLNQESVFECNIPIGMVDSRNEDTKCLISPFSNKVLKPYIRRDFESLPLKLDLNREIIERASYLKFDSEGKSIDYVHLRPEHVMQINLMCRQHFWSGIDITECLEYPDYTIVALYKKLIVGFAFMVPNTAFAEAYLSFILVHPDWRKRNETNDRDEVSVAQYMLYYLIQESIAFNVTLHVSVNSPAILFYQKFGFKIEEYVKNFYDKYYTEEHSLSKDAFLMRLCKD